MRGAAVGAEKKSSWIWRKFHRAAPPKFYAVFPCLPYLYHYLAKNSKHFSANSPAAGESRFAAARAAHKSADAPRRIAPPLARLYNRRRGGRGGFLKGRFSPQNPDIFQGAAGDPAGGKPHRKALPGAKAAARSPSFPKRKNCVQSPQKSDGQISKTPQIEGR